MDIIKTCAVILTTALVGGCSAKKEAAPGAMAPISTTATVFSGGIPRADMPKAVVYKINGDYSSHVFVNIAPDGTLLTYPAPTDVTEASSGLPVGHGWLLDRRGGIGENSRFLKWTYAQYASLPAVPTQAEILAAIIPDARVTAVRTLPISAAEALADPSLVSTLIEK